MDTPPHYEGYQKMARPSSPRFNWVYLNGQAHVGTDGHSVLLRDLADRLGIDPRMKAKVRSLWIAGLPLEPGMPIDVARGVMAPSGHADIWESNVDRNAVRDAVEQQHQGWSVESNWWEEEDVAPEAAEYTPEELAQFGMTQADPARFIYHMADPANRESILREGLRPTRRQGILNPHGVYGWRTPELAKSNWHGVSDMYEVNTEDLPLYQDDWYDDPTIALRHPEHIPPNRIRLMNEEEHPTTLYRPSSSIHVSEANASDWLLDGGSTSSMSTV